MAGYGNDFKWTPIVKLQAGAAAIMVVGSLFAVYQATRPKPTTPQCEQRYAGGVLFSLARRSGTPLQPEDIQARLGGLDWGITTNTRIVADEAVPYGYALEIDVKRGRDTQQERAGIGFTWLPRQLAAASAACLSYSFWVPPNFKSGEGGTLPGFVSETQAEQSGEDADETAPAKPASKPFSMRMLWRADGRFAVGYTMSNGQSGQLPIDQSKARMKPGEWVRVEEEIVLNEAGRHNGIMRLWIDKQLVLERFDIAYRTDVTQMLQGVLGDTHYLKNGGWTPPPADTRIRLSPLELRMK